LVLADCNDVPALGIVQRVVRTVVLFFAYSAPATPKPAQTARPASATIIGTVPSSPASSLPLLAVIVDFAAAKSRLPVDGAPAVDEDGALSAVSGVAVAVPSTASVVVIVDVIVDVVVDVVVFIVVLAVAVVVVAVVSVSVEVMVVAGGCVPAVPPPELAPAPGPVLAPVPVPVVERGNKVDKEDGGKSCH